MAQRNAATQPARRSAGPTPVHSKPDQDDTVNPNQRISRRGQTAVAEKPEEPEFDMEASAGAGAENVGAGDLAIPRISILQSGSPQAKKSEGAYIKGAEEGDFYDNVQNAILAKGEEGFLFVPVKFDRHFIEWVPKTQGGGFVAIYPGDSDIVSKTSKDPKTGRDVLPNGHEIVNTAEFYCIVAELDGSNPRPAVASFASTQFKKAKTLNSQLGLIRLPSRTPGQTFNPAYFDNAFQVTSVPESNDKGNWMGWNFERLGLTKEQKNGKELRTLGFNLHQSLSKGEVTVAPPSSNEGGGKSSDDDAAF